MFNAALLKTLDEAGMAVLTLTEGLETAELLGSRLTRSEVLRHMHLWSDAALGLPEPQRQGMPEVDWAAIEGAHGALKGSPGPALDDALILGTTTLVPNTLMWLRVYRQQHPEWFAMVG
jgi:hypothetical protein